MKVMIIDDEPVHVRGIAKYVNWSGLGYDRIVEMYSAKAALRKLQEEAFDLVITDINMPEINGLELIHRINLLGDAPAIMVVSGYDEFTYAQEAIRLGVCAYILKPVKPEEMEENVRMLAEKMKKRNSGTKAEDESMDVFFQICESERGETSAREVKGRKMHPAVQKILSYVSRNYEKEITVQELAERLEMNESYLSVLFKRETGINLSSYVQKYRAYRAMELLRHSELRINEIAYRVGYQNPSYFSEQFKKVFQITPTEVRKRGTL